MNKYRHAFLIGLQSNLVYRWNFAVRGFFSLFHLAVVFILWGAAYSGARSIGRSATSTRTARSKPLKAVRRQAP